MDGDTTGDPGREVHPTRPRAGHIIKARGIQLCLTTYCRLGKRPSAWAAIRRELAETFPGASEQSREAVIRYAQAAAEEMRRRERIGPDFDPRVGADVRRVVRDRNRER